MGEPMAWAERRTKEDYERLRDACTRQELNKLLTSPEFGDWMRRQGRHQRTRRLTWACSVITVLCAFLWSLDGIPTRDAVVQQSITVASNQVPAGAPASQQWLTQHAAAQDSSSELQAQGEQQGCGKQQRQQQCEPPVQIEAQPQRRLAAVEQGQQELARQQSNLGDASQLVGKAQGLPETLQESWPARQPEAFKESWPAEQPEAFEEGWPAQQAEFGQLEQEQQRHRLQPTAEGSESEASWQPTAERSASARDTEEREAAPAGEPIVPRSESAVLEEASTCPDEEHQQHVRDGEQQMVLGGELPSSPESECQASDAPSAPGGAWALQLGTPTTQERWALQLSPLTALHCWALHLSSLAREVPILGVLGAASLLVLLLGTCGSRFIPVASPPKAAPEEVKERLPLAAAPGAREKAACVDSLEERTESQAVPEQHEVHAEQLPPVPTAAPQQIKEEQPPPPQQQQQQQLEGLAVKAYDGQARAQAGSPVPAGPATPSSPFTPSLLAPDARASAAPTPDLLGDRAPRLSPAVRNAQAECGSKRLEQRRLEYEMATHGVEPQHEEEEPVQGQEKAWQPTQQQQQQRAGAEQPTQKQQQQLQQQKSARAEQPAQQQQQLLQDEAQQGSGESLQQLQHDEAQQGCRQASPQHRPAAEPGQRAAGDEAEQNAEQAAEQLPLGQAGQKGEQSPRQLPLLLKQAAIGSQDSPIRSWPLTLREAQHTDETEEGSEGGEAGQSQSDQLELIAEEEAEEAAATVSGTAVNPRVIGTAAEEEEEEELWGEEGRGKAIATLAPSSPDPAVAGTPSEEEASLLAGPASPEASIWVGQGQEGTVAGDSFAGSAGVLLPPGSPWGAGSGSGPWRDLDGSPWALQGAYEEGGGVSAAAESAAGSAVGSALFPASPWSGGGAAWEVAAAGAAPSVAPAELAQSGGAAWAEEAPAPRRVWSAAERSRRWLHSCVPR